MMKKIKQVIVIRKDLNMRKGKMIAQGAHASWGSLLNRSQIIGSTQEDEPNSLVIELNQNMLDWLQSGQTKVVLGIDSEKDLVELYHTALSQKLPCSLIKDAGHTEFHGQPTYTALSIGPEEDALIDTITGHLKLL